MRGEYFLCGCGGYCCWELPPRARRIRRGHSVLYSSLGTTSACAENTHTHHQKPPTRGNYLRVRGEYPIVGNRKKFIVELPPRARRIPGAVDAGAAERGTTSACAENTHSSDGVFAGAWNYLRVRGEYQHAKDLGNDESELPPRARRILRFPTTWCRDYGTTSACAENTWSTAKPSCRSRNYLRVRGEYDESDGVHVDYLELPPRARRIPPRSLVTPRSLGTTSACAENTSLAR